MFKKLNQNKFSALLYIWGICGFCLFRQVRVEGSISSVSVRNDASGEHTRTIVLTEQVGGGDAYGVTLHRRLRPTEPQQP